MPATSAVFAGSMHRLAVETHPRGTVAVAVGGGFVGENLVQLGALPLAFGQEIVGLGDGEEAPSKASLNSSIEPAPRAVCAAIDCTVANVFLTR